eukprot:849137-Pelagomonas_calceolata.AAC.2
MARLVANTSIPMRGSKSMQRHTTDPTAWTCNAGGSKWPHRGRPALQSTRGQDCCIALQLTITKNLP